MGVFSVSERVASFNEEQQRHICAFIEFMNTEFPQLTNKISFSMPMCLVGKRCMRDMWRFTLQKPLLNPFLNEEFLNGLAESLPSCKKRESDASTSNMAISSHFMQLKTA